MTCAFDWIYGGSDEPIFYDSYIARSINGDLFFEIPPETSQDRFNAHRPFQVFSCWNGAVAFTAAPVVERKVAFRGSRQEECFQGEPQLFCKDMWFNGYGKIAVVPSVNLEYSNEKGKKIKEDKGYTSQWVTKDIAVADKIEWQPPPERVKCMPTFNRQFWGLWNETLG
ncbi:cryptococcal mannosyltransferase 1-domain-containing protein [Diplogelasinospora grovesii]|uniref:Cryptococcal mannosyltransferase 1-domain-containing protein n=1 Tax=Diplogelasinospora grovesii TaxID=303347 RepID=A0AAN6RZ57_9PEZI|nr:cryptococcal mannosyltransferase 1-domain-containing protein [Diplogelasinospora grovesii]